MCFPSVYEQRQHVERVDFEPLQQMDDEMAYDEMCVFEPECVLIEMKDDLDVIENSPT